ncbi:SPOR domain-containing protein [uncultured Treponema sp.]|uniref:SPOR domain-containing protein n=1 Tax=uncultured Treponema sp. TaxID=162155 RepID=UPI0026397C93|nr:SPOR domain-containing protein [uncultured Treponema sp.]
MKKFLSGILFLLISVFIFADSSASIEGVIEVAGKDDLPAGYFGKAAGYLPGDSVSITNPNTGITLQILNLGTLDASGGIAILISEESAKSLGIERNSGVKVKLAPRSGYFDETVSGSAVLDEKTLPAEKAETAEISSEPAVQSEPEVANQTAETAAVAAEVAPVAVAGVPLIADTEDNGEEEKAEVSAVEDELPADEAETPSEETDSEVEAEQSEEIASENEDDFSDVGKLAAEPVEEAAADEEPSVESAEEETEPVVVEAPAPIEECEVPQDDEEPSAEDVSEEPYEDYESIEDGFLESKEAVEQPSPAEESEEEAVTVEEPSPIEEEAEDSPEEENAEPVIVEEPQPEEEAEAPAEDEIEEEAITVEEPSPIEDDSAAEEKQAEEVSEPEEVVEEPAAEPEAQAEPEIHSSDEDESSDYAPIILVPSEPESPESATASAEDEPIEIVPVESVPEEKKSEPEPLHSEYPVNIQNHVVSSESALASNCYYVQIATMGNIKNIENLLVKYSKYPISLIPAGKNYRVLVGPLSVDEYGAVLAKFKDAGFKDAFVRKR